ncbi:hypothetical protein THRCLA_20701 [Thraustotheca clavata]|uniref:Uncharacterized protein n=1 Tax=Thraustotheca clavata TaxID=74557 RepID=A0A1W0A4N5_9STRA|nr:hypothetical protein THRCLA_20701 [Thraustotheca clavata]
MSDLEQPYSDEEFQEDHDALQAALDEDDYEGGDWDIDKQVNDYHDEEFGEEDKISTAGATLPNNSSTILATANSPTEDEDYNDDNEFNDDALFSPISKEDTNADEDKYEDDTEPQATIISTSPVAYPDDDYTDANDFDATEPQPPNSQPALVENTSKLAPPTITPTITMDDEMNYTDDNDSNEDLEPTPLMIASPKSPLDYEEETYTNDSPVAYDDDTSDDKNDKAHNSGKTLFEDIVATVLNEVKDNDVIFPALGDNTFNANDYEMMSSIPINNEQQVITLPENDTPNDDYNYSNTSSQENLYTVDPDDYDTYNDEQAKIIDENATSPAIYSNPIVAEHDHVHTKEENLYSTEPDEYSDDPISHEHVNTSELVSKTNILETDDNYSCSNTSSQEKLYADDDAYTDDNVVDKDITVLEPIIAKQPLEIDTQDKHSLYDKSSSQENLFTINTSSQENIYTNDTTDDFNESPNQKEGGEPTPPSKPTEPEPDDLYGDHTYINASSQEKLYTTGTDEYDGYDGTGIDKNDTDTRSENHPGEQSSYESYEEASDTDGGYTYDDAMKELAQNATPYHADEDVEKDTEDHYNTRTDEGQKHYENLNTDKLDGNDEYYTHDELPTTEVLIPISVEVTNSTTQNELSCTTFGTMDGQADVISKEPSSPVIAADVISNVELNELKSTEPLLPLTQELQNDDQPVSCLKNANIDGLTDENNTSPKLIHASPSHRSINEQENEQTKAELQHAPSANSFAGEFELHHEKSAFDLSDQNEVQDAESVSNMASSVSAILPNKLKNEEGTIQTYTEHLREVSLKGESELIQSFENIEQMRVEQNDPNKKSTEELNDVVYDEQPLVDVNSDPVLHQELNKNPLSNLTPSESDNSPMAFVTDEFLYDITPTPPSNNSRRNSINEATQNWDNYEPEVIEDETTKLAVTTNEYVNSLEPTTISELIPHLSLKEVDKIKSSSQLDITTTDVPQNKSTEPTTPLEPISNEVMDHEYEEDYSNATRVSTPLQDNESDYNADFVEEATQEIANNTNDSYEKSGASEDDSSFQPESNRKTEILNDDIGENDIDNDAKSTIEVAYEDEYVDDIVGIAEAGEIITIDSSEAPQAEPLEIPVIASGNYEDKFEANNGASRASANQSVYEPPLVGTSNIETSREITQGSPPQESNDSLAEVKTKEISDSYEEENTVPQVAEIPTANNTYKEWPDNGDYDESLDNDTEKAVEQTTINTTLENQVETNSSGIQRTTNSEDVQHDEAIIQSVHLEDTPSESNEVGADENEEEDQILLATVESLKNDATRVPSSGDNYLDEFRGEDDDNADSDDMNAGESFYEEGFDEEPFESLASIRAKLGIPEASTSNNAPTEVIQSKSNENEAPLVVTPEELNNYIHGTRQSTVEASIPIDDVKEVIDPVSYIDALPPSTEENMALKDQPGQPETVVSSEHENQNSLVNFNASTLQTPSLELISKSDELVPNVDNEVKLDPLISQELPNYHQTTDKPPSVPSSDNFSRRSIAKSKDTPSPTTPAKSPVTPRKAAAQKERVEKENRKTKAATPTRPKQVPSSASSSPAPSKLETKLKSRILASKPKKVEIEDRLPPSKPPVPRQNKVVVVRPVENVVTPVRPKTATNLYHCPPTLSPRLPLDSKTAMAFNSPQKDYRPWRQDKPKSLKKKKPVVVASPPKVRFEPKVDKVKEEWLLLNMFRQGDVSKYESFCHFPKHIDRPSSADLQLRPSATYQTSTRKLVDPKKRSERLNLEARERNWVDIPNQKTPIPTYEAILDKYCHTITSPYVQKQIYNTVDLSPQLAYVLEKRVQQQRQAEVAFLIQSPKMKPTRPSNPSPNPTSSHSSNDIVSLRWSNLTKD